VAIICSVCFEHVGHHEIKCFVCDGVVHVSCSKEFDTSMYCLLCYNKKVIEMNRIGAHKQQKREAEKMMTSSNKKFKPSDIGDNVLVRIPEVDRSRITPRNILAVVVDHDKENNLYELAIRLLEFCHNASVGMSFKPRKLKM
jgi:hypothetical protein